jgi:hypothetical protein
VHRIAKLGVAAVAAIALATPALTTVADAAPAGHQSVVAKHKKKPAKLKLKKSAKGVQPGIAGMSITAVGVKGKVKFTVKGDAGKVASGKVKAKKGKAVYAVPPLGTGKYKVSAKAAGKKPGKTKFEVYDSQLTVNTTSYTFSAANASKCYSQPGINLTGSIRYKGAPATTGYADVYENGQIAGGSSSPYLLGFTGLRADGTFDYTDFLCDVVNGGTGSAETAKGPGVYHYNVYYTADADYFGYISSNEIVVTITA